MEFLTLPKMLSYLRGAIESFPDNRTGKNTQYPLGDVALGAFSIFFTQSPSFLAHQRFMQESMGKNNASSLFGVDKIPSDNQIRNLLDGVSPEKTFSVFDLCFKHLNNQGYLKKFQVQISSQEQLLIALDGTEHFSSEKISCQNCSTKEHKKGVKTYSHNVITPVIVSPNQDGYALPLVPEYITPQDGQEKQDCESKAGKRWIKTWGKQYAHLGVTILGDDLYSRQPMCQEILKVGLHFVLVCKRESHIYLYNWVDELEEEVELISFSTRVWTGKYHKIITYRFTNHVPIKDGQDGLFVNWCEIIITKEEDGKKIYHNSFISDHEITIGNVEDIISYGRTRWKIENENNNTLKTKGYHFEHNFGHGQKNLSSLLASFTLLAFLFHTVMGMTDNLYQALRGMLPSREIFFNDIKALVRYMYFEDWERLFIFMIEGLKKKHILEFG